MRFTYKPVLKGLFHLIVMLYRLVGLAKEDATALVEHHRLCAIFLDGGHVMGN